MRWTERAAHPAARVIPTAGRGKHTGKSLADSGAGACPGAVACRNITVDNSPISVYFGVDRVVRFDLGSSNEWNLLSQG